jgi:quinol monooxygenase YgiN
MSNVRVVATIPTKPESAAAVRAALTELAEATNAEEGCISYEAFESATAPGVFVMIECWRDQSIAGEVGIHPLTAI